VSRAAPFALALLAAALALPSCKAGDGSLTVTKFQETYASLLGTRAKVRGLYLSTNEVRSGDVTSYTIVLVPDRKEMKVSATCHLAAKPLGLKQFDEVVAEGRVDKSFGQGDLRDCSFHK
jgi:hypothetical protein